MLHLFCCILAFCRPRRPSRLRNIFTQNLQLEYRARRTYQTRSSERSRTRCSRTFPWTLGMTRSNETSSMYRLSRSEGCVVRIVQCHWKRES
ncbi:hypothetical protein BDV98DRAFT_567358 [Pterulicium gracile]|uniref:Uncharacterized protein n=1 Tax=Pterulicium gracile TaxID=1884261 RepID=A0A5C3QN52_9AGAR|nr:hypothetical protein BDV98DRAFT_567358 [Pterula gracilis]